MRPIGDWSMSTILSRWLDAVEAAVHAGMLARAVQPLASALYSVSTISVLLPLPDTPVTQVKVPSGMLAVTFCRLFSRAPLTVSQRPPLAGGSRRDLGHRDLAEARTGTGR